MVWINWGADGLFQRFGSRKVRLNWGFDGCVHTNDMMTWMDWGFKASLNCVLDVGDRPHHVGRSSNFLDTFIAEITDISGVDLFGTRKLFQACLSFDRRMN